jgi:hypothetical protein
MVIAGFVVAHVQSGVRVAVSDLVAMGECIAAWEADFANSVDTPPGDRDEGDPVGDRPPRHA